MAAFETAIYSCLTESATLAALVSNSIWPVRRVQGSAMPCVVYARDGGERVWSLGGYLSLENARVSIEVYADTVDELRTVGSAVLSALSSSTMAAVTQESGADYWDDAVEAYARTYTVSIWNRE